MESCEVLLGSLAKLPASAPQPCAVFEGAFSLGWLINTCWYFFKLGVILFLVAVVGIGVYLYTRMDSEIRNQVEEILSRQFPHLNVSVGAARLVENQGIAIHDLVISETNSNQLQSNLLVIDELVLECNVELAQLVKGPPDIRRIVVRHPELWISRELDGHWNLESLWPPPSCGTKPPQISVEDARVTIVDQLHPTAVPLSLRDIDLVFEGESLPPANSAALGAIPELWTVPHPRPGGGTPFSPGRV